jgi:type I restriction enzyme S subunit
MKRFIDPSYTLPDGWYASKLIELAEIHNNRRKPINSLERVNMKGPFPYCGANNVVDYINKYEFDGEYLLIAEDGGYWGKNEPTSYIMRGKFWVNNHAHIVKAKEGKTTNQFLCYILNYLNLDPIIGGDARGKLTKAVLTELLIPHPDFPEQRKIAYVLSTVQKAIEQQDKLIRTTTELKKALMQKLFTEGTKGEKLKQTEIGWVPESWEVVELSDVCEKPQYGFTNSASSHGNAKFLRITDITEFGVNWNEVPFCNCHEFSKYELKDGDIVFARIGATTGKSYLINKPPKSVYASYLIRVRCKKMILPDFLIYYFATEQYWKQINATKGNNLKGGVNGSILSKLLIPKPSIKEQKNIADAFKSIDNKLDFFLKKKQTLTVLFKTLLHELMTGQRRVHELEFEGLNKEYKMEEQPLSMAAEK